MRKRGAGRRRPRSAPTRPGTAIPTLGRTILIVLLSASFLALVAFVYRPSFSTPGQTTSVVDDREAGASSPDFIQPSSTVENQRIADVRFTICGRKPVTCVVDGDTFWLEGEKIRIADINTPEIRSPQCAAERTLGVRAAARLIELLNQGRFEVRRADGANRDRYGRLLRVVERDGISLGDQLIVEGLAHQWEGRRLSWCAKT